MSLESLPAETLLNITTYISDLDTLCCLVRASPAARRLFDRFAIEITEQVLANSWLYPQIKEFFGAIVYLRSPDTPWPFLSLEQLQLEFICKDRTLETPKFIKLENMAPPGKAALSVSALLSTIATARRISLLTQSCLDTLLERLYDPSNRPKISKCTGLLYSGGYGPENAWVHPWRREHSGEPVGALYDGPFTWGEEMRVTRALWMTQFIKEMQLAAKRGLLGWSNEDIETIYNMETVQFASHLNEPGHGHTSSVSWVGELETITEFLQDPDCHAKIWHNADIGDGACAEHILPRPIAKTGAAWWTQPVRYNQRVIYPGPETGPYDAESAELYMIQIERESSSMSIFRSLRNDRHNSPLCGIKFDIFRRLGLAIWGRNRLNMLGFLPGRQTEILPPDTHYFTWKSVVPEAEIAKINGTLDEEEGMWWAALEASFFERGICQPLFCFEATNRLVVAHRGYPMFQLLDA